VIEIRLNEYAPIKDNTCKTSGDHDQVYEIKFHGKPVNKFPLKNSNIEKVRDILSKIISEKHSKSNLENLPKTAAFFSEKDEVVNDNYKLKDKEFISIIPPIGGG